MSLIGSSGTSTAYYYFYGFEMIDYDEICKSDRARVGVFVDVGSSVSQDPFNQALIYPNPTLDLLTIEQSVADDLHYVISDFQGRRLIEGDCNSNCGVDLNDLTAGYYFIQLTNKFASFSKKFLKL